MVYNNGKAQFAVGTKKGVYRVFVTTLFSSQQRTKIYNRDITKLITDSSIHTNSHQG